MSSKLKIIAFKCFELYFSIPFKIASKFHKKLPQEMMAAVCKSYERITNNYTTIKCRPVKENQVFVLPDNVSNHYEEFALILQGPPDYNDDFTLESIRLYKKLFPKVNIILSTWTNVTEEYIEKVKKLGCNIVLNERPTKSGRGNINFQVKSSFGGIIKAKELGCKYVFKTRTDQRIYNHSLCDFLAGLLMKFPSNIEGQKSRIVVLQGSTGCMFLPYYIADFFYFGETEDMLKLFEMQEDNYHFSLRDEINKFDSEQYKNYSLGEAVHRCAPQNLIMEKYANDLGYVPDGTVKQYWDFVRDGLIGITVEQVGLFWKKYTSNIFENSWSHSYEFGDSDEQLLTYNWTFENWFSLYSDVIVYKSEYEKYKSRFKRI